MTEIDQMSSVEIREHISQYRSSLMTLNGQVKGQKKDIENPMRIRQTKRTIARMITVLVRRGERVVT
jgi:ribosomal protein L29